MLVTVVNKVLATLTIAAQLTILIGLAYLLRSRGQREKQKRPFRFLHRNCLPLSFAVALIATSFSLFYSNIAGFEPCTLCWWQRIFMYPQVPILGIAWKKRDRRIIPYSLTIAILGGLIALYHNYLYYGGAPIIPCSAYGLGASCTRRYVFEYGFVTIPLMSLTAFSLLSGLLALGKSRTEQEGAA